MEFRPTFATAKSVTKPCDKKEGLDDAAELQKYSSSKG